MQIIHQMTMDLAVPLPVLPVTAVQGDGNTRVLAVTLLENGAPWNIPASAVVDVAFRKADGTKGIYSRLPDGSNATTASGNVLHATLAPQMLTCPGQVLATVVFRTDGNKTLAAFPFTVTVAANPGAGAEVSEDYFNPTQISDLRAELAAGLATKAPAGYGLGEVVKAANADDCTENGWYVIENDGAYGCSILVQKINDNFIYQLKRFTDDGDRMLIQFRQKHSGIWGYWYWLNPPMLPGMEYRTMERYMGSIVYTKAVDIGALPSNDSKLVAHGIDGVASFVSIRLIANYPGGGEGIEFTYGASNTVQVLDGKIKVMTGFNTGGYSGVVILKYTKS